MEKSTHLVQTTSNEPSEEVKVKKNRKQITTAKKKNTFDINAVSLQQNVQERFGLRQLELC